MHTQSRLMPGAFGVVSLVRERITGKLYAMKQVRVFRIWWYITLIVFVCLYSCARRIC
jgi:hypothetical protein